MKPSRDLAYLDSRIVRMAAWTKEDIAAGDALSEAANGQILEGLAGKLLYFPFCTEGDGKPSRVFSRGMIETDLFCKRITVTQSEIQNRDVGEIRESRSKGFCVFPRDKWQWLIAECQEMTCEKRS